MQYINIPAGSTYPLILGEDILAMNTSKIYLQCDTVGVGAINILLPKITIPTPVGSSIKNWFLEIFINDIGVNANNNNIKITPNPSDIINGSPSQIILNTKGVTGRLVITGKNAWDFSKGGAGSAQIPFAIEVNLIEQIGQVYQFIADNISTGVAPFTYQWAFVSKTTGVTGINNFGTCVFSGSINQQTVDVVLAPDQSNTGIRCMIRCKVTDSNGLIQYGYYFIDKFEPIIN